MIDGYRVNAGGHDGDKTGAFSSKEPVGHPWKQDKHTHTHIGKETK